MLNQDVDIDAVLLDCVQRGLDHFGSSFKYVVYHELKSADNVEGKMIVRKPLTFSNELDRLFGAGAVAIKKAIMGELATKFSLKTDQEDLISIINRLRSGAEV